MRAPVCFLFLNLLTALARSPFEAIPGAARHFAGNSALFSRAVTRAGSEPPVELQVFKDIEPHLKSPKRKAKRKKSTAPKMKPNFAKRALFRREDNTLQRFGRSPLVTGCIILACVIAAYTRWHNAPPPLPLIHVHEQQAAQIHKELSQLRTSQLNAAGKNALNARLRQQEIEFNQLSQQLQHLRGLRAKGAPDEPELRKLEDGLTRALKSDQELRELLMDMHAESSWNKYLVRHGGSRDGRLSGLPTPSARRSSEEQKDHRQHENSELVKRSQESQRVLVPRALFSISSSFFRGACFAVVCVALTKWIKYLPAYLVPDPPLRLLNGLEAHRDQATKLHEQLGAARAGAFDGKSRALTQLYEDFE